MGNSYTAARIHGMRKSLIKEYDRLVKMGDQELLGFLQATTYRQEIDALAIKDLSNTEVIDRILAENSKREFAKLDRIATADFKIVLEYFLKANDAWNLITLAEAMAGNTDPQVALQYQRKGIVDPSIFLSAKSLQELSKRAAHLFPILRTTPSHLQAFRESLKKDCIKQAMKLPGHVKSYLIDEYNIITLLLLKRDKASESEILKRLQRGGTMGNALRKAASMSTLSESLAALRTTRYAGIIDRASVELQQGALVRFEYELHNEMLKSMRNVAAGAPLDPVLLISYITEKEIEHDNLRLIVKARQLGLGEEFVKEHLVV